MRLLTGTECTANATSDVVVHHRVCAFVDAVLEDRSTKLVLWGCAAQHHGGELLVDDEHAESAPCADLGHHQGQAPNSSTLHK
jgi:hypothetical protein